MSRANPASPPADRAITLSGVQLTAPADDRWTPVERGETLTVLSLTTPEVTARLSAQVLPADASGDDAAFLRATEAARVAEVSALEMQGEHYSGGTLSGATCLAYDGTYRDAQADPARQFHTRRGYLCRHPEIPTQSVRLELTFDSKSKAPADAEPLLRAADTFFHSAVFHR